ncbi:MAG: hypothetical protein ACFCUU_16400 [Cyclobacteriaceae bacterium]
MNIIVRQLNMIPIRQLYCVMALMILAGQSLWAQDDTFIREGEKIEGEVVIQKDLKIELPPADRNFEKISPQNFSTADAQPLNYRTTDYPMTITDLSTHLRVLKIKSDDPSELKGNYIKGGFGNYATPYLKGYFGMGKNPNANFNLNVGHISSARGPVDTRNSADGHTTIGLNGKFSAKKLKIGSFATYNRDKYHFYGYTPGVEISRDSIRQVYHSASIGIDFTTLDVEAPFKIRGDLSFSHISDRFDVSENNVRANLGFDFELNDEVSVVTDVNTLFSKFTFGDTQNRSLVGVASGLRYKIKGFEAEGGFRFVLNNDTIASVRKTSIFPWAKASYQLTEMISAYASLDGNVHEVTLDKISRENPFLRPGTSLAHTQNNLDLSGGFRGRLANSVGFDAGFSLGNSKNLYFYQLFPEAANQFTMLYDDESTTYYSFQTSLSYSIQKVGGVAADIKFIGYNTRAFDEAWHRPNFIANVNGWYNLYDKIMLKTDIFGIAGIRALDPVSFETKELKPAVDINLQADYRFSDRWGAFLMVNNLLTRKYELLLNYPNRSILLIAGLSLEF